MVGLRLRRGRPQQREPGRRSRPAGEARCHCWGGGEEEGWTIIRNSLNWSVHMPVGPQRVGWLWCRLKAVRSLVLV